MSKGRKSKQRRAYLKMYSAGMITKGMKVPNRMVLSEMAQRPKSLEWMKSALVEGKLMPVIRDGKIVDVVKQRSQVEMTQHPMPRDSKSPGGMGSKVFVDPITGVQRITEIRTRPAQEV